MSKHVLLQVSSDNHKCIRPELRLNEDPNSLELNANKIN